MRFLVLGGGLQGSASAYDLLQQPDVERVTLADLDPGRAGGFLPEDTRLERVQADFKDAARVRELMGAHEIALSAAPSYLNSDLTRAAIQEGCHFSDLGGNAETVREQIAMADAAREAGCMIVPGVGLAPGMVNVLAAEGIRRLDTAHAVRMYVGGLPQNPVPPLNYQVVYSLEGMLENCAKTSRILRGGRLTDVEALSEVEELAFDGLGPLEAFHTAAGASLQPWEFEGEIQELFYKTMRYPGNAAIMRTVRELGLLSQEPVPVKSVDVSPRDLFIACVTPLLTNPEEPDLVALRVVAEGESAGRDSTLTWDVIDYADPRTGISAMGRTTGFTLAIVGLFLGRGIIGQRGAAASYQVIPYEPYVEELATRGIEIRFREA